MNCCIMLHIAVDYCRLLRIATDCYGLLRNAANCCRLLQIATNCCRLQWIPADCCRLLLITTDCCILLRISADCYQLLWMAANCNRYCKVPLKQFHRFWNVSKNSLCPLCQLHRVYPKWPKLSHAHSCGTRCKMVWDYSSSAKLLASKRCFNALKQICAQKGLKLDAAAIEMVQELLKLCIFSRLFSWNVQKILHAFYLFGAKAFSMPFQFHHTTNLNLWIGFEMHFLKIFREDFELNYSVNNRKKSSVYFLASSSGFL